MNACTVAGLGEVLFDVLAASEQIGGAPMNFAYHVNALGARGLPVSTVGDDERGERALRELAERGLDVSAVSVLPGSPTGYVTADVNAEGVAEYTFPDDVAWDRLSLNKAAMAAAKEADAVCFGSLAQRSPASKAAIETFLDATRPETLKVFDLNLRQTFYSKTIIEDSLKRADALKLSDEELPALAGWFALTGKQADMVSTLVRLFGLRLCVLTRGGDGSLLATPDQISEHPGVPTEISDTIGAGDAFTASAVLGLLLGGPLDEINDHANRLAAYVCSQAGAMPPIPASLRLL